MIDMYCSNCGVGIPENAAFCPGCGKPLKARYAGFWKRFVALIIDGLVFLPANLVLAALLRDSAAYYLSSFVLGWLYFTLLESSPKQATLGKMAMGLFVTDLYGQRISFGRANARYFSKILSGLTLFIGYMMAGWTNKKQALHDVIASTLVMQKAD